MLNTLAFGLVALAFLVFVVVAFVVVVVWLVRLTRPKPAPALFARPVAEPLRPMAATPEVNLMNLARDYKRLRAEEEEIAATRRTLDQVVFLAGKLPVTEAPAEAPKA